VWEVGLGELSIVEEAIENQQDLDAYCPIADGQSDEYTLLCYRCCTLYIVLYIHYTLYIIHNTPYTMHHTDTPCSTVRAMDS
jgi:hypothetical protein